MKILPGATIGILGDGQLGRMLALVARRMGYRVHTFGPEYGAPAAQVADRSTVASFDDLRALEAFAAQVDVVTLEFENVPALTAETVAAQVPMRPAGHVLFTTQHRLREKMFLKQAGFPLTPFRAVAALPELQAALAELGYPAVLKTAGFGYDGKGQYLLRSVVDAEAAWQALGGQEAVLEAFVPFEREVSVVAARSLQGDVLHYGVIENQHRHHILDLSLAPATLPAPLAAQATTLATAVLDALDVVGVLCVEFFVTTQGELLINELAPRPHNSGHLTIDACVTSQFEQQLRAVCGLPLGAPDLIRPAAMANLLGDVWADGEPDWAAAYAVPAVKLHLYGKQNPRPGRKMGHLTALAPTVEEAAALVQQAREQLQRQVKHPVRQADRDQKH